MIPRSSIANDLDNPVILGITNSGVTVARDFVVGLGDGSGDLVRVKVAASLSVNETNDIAIAGEAELLVCVIGNLMAVGVEEPVVVSIFVVVASDLLLSRAFRVGLDVRVEQTSTVTHVLQCGAGTVCDLERAVLADFGAAQVGLEKRTHLSVTRTTVLEDQEVEVKGKGVNGERDEDETEDAEGNVSNELHLFKLASVSDGCTQQTHLGHLEVAELVPKVLNSVQTDQSSDEESNPLDTADASNGDTSEHQPQTPLRREGVVLLTVELGPAEDGGECEAKKHRVEENETADSGVRVLAENSQGNKPDCRAAEVQFLCGEVGQGHADGTERGVEQAHEGVVELLRVGLATLKFERPVVSCKVSRGTDEHLAERRVDIEVELALEVVGTELAETV